MDTELLKQSITKNNYTVDNPNRGLHWLLVGSGIGRTGLPEYWSPLRDAYLRQVLYSEYHDFWAGAVGIAVTKIASLGWDVAGTQPRLRDYYQQLYLDSDGNQSWVSFIARHLQSFLCTDNGAFVEIVRASKGAGSRILGLMHLDSLRVTRTGDAEIPVIYQDLLGYEHEVAAHQVLMLSDMPSPSASLHNVGFCATSRAWTAIRKMEAVERYIYEKISGDRALSLDLVKGIAPKDIRSAVESAREDRAGRNSQNGDASGAFLYMGSVVVPVLDDAPLAHTRIDFASLPDGFNYAEHFDKSVLQMANALGLDVQDLQPLTGRALGTGAQSQVLDEKSKGKGLSAWRQQWTHLNNQLVLPSTVTFAFSEDDLRDQKARADVFAAAAGAVAATIASGMITAAQGTQILADEGFIPKEFVPVDTTPQESIADYEKPLAESQAQDETATAETVPPTDVTTKELRAQFADALARFNAAMTVTMKYNENHDPENGQFAEGGGGGGGSHESSGVGAESNRDIAVVNHYKNTGYAQINRGLREGNESNLSASQKNEIATLDRLVKSEKLGQPTVLYRAIQGKRAGDQYLNPGKTVIDKAFMSTSTSKYHAIKASEDAGGSATVMTTLEIHAPSGTNAFNIQSRTTKNPIGYMSQGDEAEFLLGRNTKIKVISIDATNRHAIGRIE